MRKKCICYKLIKLTQFTQNGLWWKQLSFWVKMVVILWVAQQQQYVRANKNPTIGKSPIEYLQNTYKYQQWFPLRFEHIKQIDSIKLWKFPMDKYGTVNYNCQINKQPRNKAIKMIKFKLSKKAPKFYEISKLIWLFISKFVKVLSKFCGLLENLN